MESGKEKQPQEEEKMSMKILIFVFSFIISSPLILARASCNIDSYRRLEQQRKRRNIKTACNPRLNVLCWGGFELRKS